jgi:16S rRNA processing protein RimM
MEYIKIGKILTTKGLKGEVKVKAFTNLQDQRFQVGNIVYIEVGNQYLPLQIIQHKTFKNLELLTFKDFEDINKIEQYQGFDLFAVTDDEVVLEDNEYMVDDLIGVEVYQNNILKGEVKEIISYPQGDYLLVSTDNGESLIPFRDEFIIELTSDRIDVIDMEGLF